MDEDALGDVAGVGGDLSLFVGDVGSAVGEGRWGGGFVAFAEEGFQFVHGGLCGGWRLFSFLFVSILLIGGLQMRNGC